MQNSTLKFSSLVLGMFAFCAAAMAETGVATASFVGGGGYYDDDLGQFGVAYDKSDDVIVLKNFVNGKDLTINVGEYDGSQCPLQFVDAEGVGANTMYEDEWGLEYATYKFEQNLVYGEEEIEFIYVDMFGIALSYYQPNRNVLVLDYQSAVTEGEANLKIDFNTPWEGDMPVGVSELTIKNDNQAYDLMGCKLQQVQKGLNVVNGKVIYCK